MVSLIVRQMWWNWKDWAWALAVVGAVHSASQRIQWKAMMIRLMMMPVTILAVSYSALSDSMVVRVPAPAINGNAIGKTLALAVCD